MTSPSLPIIPDKIHILAASHTNLGIGQTGQYIYPISTCCGALADKRTYDDEETSFYCYVCDQFLEVFSGHEPDYVEINAEYKPMDRHVLLIAINNWTFIPPSDYTVEIT